MSSESKPKKNLRRIVAAGDLVIDWFEVPVSGAGRHEKSVRNWKTYPGLLRFAKPGGALLLAGFLEEAAQSPVAAPELRTIGEIPSSEILHFFISLDKFPYSSAKKDEKTTVYRIKEFKGYAGPAADGPRFPAIKNDLPDADIVVIDDAGNGFRDSATHWPKALGSERKPLVIIKMFRPIAAGALWEEVQSRHAERLILILSADDLREEGVKISRRLSWERTAKEFVWQMASNPRFHSLNNCACLIVRFGLEGAILHRRQAGVVESRLFFDPKTGEDGMADIYPGKMTGTSSAFTAALAAAVAQDGLPGIPEGIRRGLIAARRLRQLGFEGEKGVFEYPVPEIFAPPASNETAISDVLVPNPTATEPADPDYWCILDDLSQVGLEDVAYNFVAGGKDPSLDGVPIGQFGNLRTYDRSEIESFRSIKNLIGEYLATPESVKPLCIAVFGAPGSGKSFGVTEVAESVSPGRLQKIEFNLSQFTTIDELAAAFHKVRDIALGGRIPIVFFDEFDSEFHGKLGWLKYFLAPMQDGKFSDGKDLHPIGKSILVFAGGTCCTFAQFSRGEGDAEFKGAKGPDFVSRLRGYVNIKGPNPMDGKDWLFMIRRALVLRFQLEKNARHIFDKTGRCHIDPGVLRAFIKIPEYKHGVRSLLAIIEMSMLAGRKIFEQAALPSPEQLELHVDAEMFSRLVVRDVLLGSARDVLAKAIHEKFRVDNQAGRPEDDPAMAAWEDLMESLKESNRQQADHIPIKLRAVGCDFAPVSKGKPITPMAFSREEIEVMAKLEHERWVVERYLQGYSLGEKKDHQMKISPYLVEWEKLEEKIKDYDRNAVRGIPDLLTSAGFEIYRLKRR